MQIFVEREPSNPADDGGSDLSRLVVHFGLSRFGESRESKESIAVKKDARLLPPHTSDTEGSLGIHLMQFYANVPSPCTGCNQMYPWHLNAPYFYGAIRRGKKKRLWDCLPWRLLLNQGSPKACMYLGTFENRQVD